MRDSLSKSVQMAIEISTKSIERFAQHEAKRTEQKARGELERQKLQNEEVNYTIIYTCQTFKGYLIVCLKVKNC